MFSVELFKYLIVGGLNTILTTIIYFTLLKIFSINYIVALSLSWISGVMFTYALNFLWVFKPENKLCFRGRFSKYFVTYLSSFVFNLVSLHVLVQTYHMDPFLAQVLLMPFIVGFNYLLNKYWSLRRIQE